MTTTWDRTPRRRRPPTPGDPARFMVIAAHPDDAEFGPAGTAARWIDEGSVGWLVCCTSGDQGGEDPDADPLELAALRETRAAAAAGDHRLCRGDVPAPAGRRAGQRPRPARACSSARSGPSARTRSSRPTRDPVLRGWRREPHRPSGGRHGRRGRRLPGGPQPDGVPGPRPRPASPRTTSGGSTSSGRTTRTPGSTSRRRWSASSMRCASTRQPDPRRWTASPSGSGRGRRRRARRSARRRPRPCGWSSSTTTRTRDRDAAGERAPASGERRSARPRAAAVARGPTRSRRPPGRPRADPSIVTSSPRVRSPGRAGEPLVGGDGHVANSSRHLVSVGQWRMRIGSSPGIAQRQRQVALRRDALVDPAAEAIESVAQRRERARRCRGSARAVNGPQKA